VASESHHLTGLAGRYAMALYELADEAKALDAVAADLAALKGQITQSDDLRRLVTSPLIPRAEQAKAMLALVEKAGLSDITRRFVGTVARNRRLASLVDIINGFTSLLAAHRGEIAAEVTSAKALSSAQADALGNALRAAIGKKVSVQLNVDPKLLGGLKVKVGSRLIDASIASKLQRLQLAMKGV